MTWFLQALSGSIGKKVVVAVAGLGLCGFLLAHLAGNLLFFVGPEALDGYARLLEESPLLIPGELALAAIFLVHIVMAVWVTLGNWRARPARYHAKRWEGGKTIGSSTMWITGSVILIFLIVHLLNFRLADRSEKTLYWMGVELFQSVPYTIGYVLAMFVVGLHVSHGFQSAFRSLGLVHPRFTSFVSWVAWIFAAVMALGFSSIPVWIYLYLDS